MSNKKALEWGNVYNNYHKSVFSEQKYHRKCKQQSNVYKFC